MNLIEFTEFLVKSIVRQPDLVKVQSFNGDEDSIILEIIVSEEDMGTVIGRGGKMASSIRTMILAYAYIHGLKHVKMNIDSF